MTDWLDLLGPPGTCSGCGAAMSWQAAKHEDRYVWADDDGRTVVETGLPHPLEVAHEIGRRITAATTGPKRKRGPMPSDEECDYYSVIIHTPWAFGQPHLHRHDRQPLHGMDHEPADVPWCCGMPMHLRPSGWHCREKCRAVLAHA